MALLSQPPKIKGFLKIKIPPPRQLTEEIVLKPIPKIKASIKPCVSQKDKDAFVCNMQPHVFDVVTTIPNQSTLSNPKNVARHMELLQTQLLESLYWNSGFYYRLSEENIGDSRFIIAGTNDTPYQNGLFLFNMVLPEDYPARPPSVLLYSTSHGQIRMNPNLYACGKVCLSLLGTWSGPGWDSKSTLSQVLLALQAQVMNDKPLANEPGCERVGIRVHNMYNAIMRVNTIKVGMCEMLEDPPEGFESMVISFFTSAKKIEIAKQLVSWSRMARELEYTPEVLNSVLCHTTQSAVGGATIANFKEQLELQTKHYATKVLNFLDMTDYISML